MRQLKDHQHPVIALAFSPSGDQLASIALHGQPCIWSIIESKAVLRYPDTPEFQSESAYSTLAWQNRNGKASAERVLALGRRDGIAEIISTDDSKLVARINPPALELSVNGLTYFNNGKYLAVSLG